jgi:hypothetical protein
MLNMNCEAARTSLLLQDSGELPGNELPPLLNHLKSCRPCRDFQVELESLRHALACQAAALPGPSPRVMGTIRAAARECHPAPRWMMRPYWKSALAAAAGLLLCLAGIRLLAPGSRDHASPVATEILPLAALIMGIDAYEEPSSGYSDLAALANQLLILQEMTTEFSDDDTANEFISPEDNLPTTLQWHNSSESHRGKYG